MASIQFILQTVSLYLSNILIECSPRGQIRIVRITKGVREISGGIKGLSGLCGARGVVVLLPLTKLNFYYFIGFFYVTLSTFERGTGRGQGGKCGELCGITKNLSWGHAIIIGPMITLCDNVAHKGCRRIKDKPRRERDRHRERDRDGDSARRSVLLLAIISCKSDTYIWPDFTSTFFVCVLRRAACSPFASCCLNPTLKL